MKSYPLESMNVELEQVVERAVKRTLQELGVISKFISRKEMVQAIGRGNYDRGVREGRLNIVKKGGRTSTIYCSRSEFEQYATTV